MTRSTFTPLAATLLLAACLGSQPAAAQVKMPKGAINFYVKTGIGYLQTSKFNAQDYNNAKKNYKGKTPFLAVGYDLAISKGFTLGLLAGYSTFHTEAVIPSAPNEMYTGDIKAYNLFATVKYYLPVTVGKIAPYVHADLLGLTAYSERTYHTVNGQASLLDPSINIKGNYGIYAGAAYSLGERFSALAELGYGYTLLNVGLNVHVKH